MRILGIDMGKVRIGVAVSDSDGLMALPMDTIQSMGHKKNAAAIAELQRKSEAGAVVVGMPIRLDGTGGPAAEFVGRFINELRSAVTVEVIPWDERLTSSQANKLMISADVSRKSRRGAVDSMAAAIMLQSYLDCERTMLAIDGEPQ
jgi:putative Holliday junction resolvase